MKVAAALLTRTSSGASRQIASIIASTAAPSRMSHLTEATLPPKSWRISAAAASSNSSRRPQMISSAPSATKRRPIATLSPEPPPATKIRFPPTVLFQTLFKPSTRLLRHRNQIVARPQIRHEAFQP
jgi:hypothetical protein